MSPFSVLGIAPTLELQQIKSAYFASLRRFPPQEHPHEFQRVRAAYEALLTDEGRRAHYASVASGAAEVLASFREHEQALCAEARQAVTAAIGSREQREALFEWASRRTLAQVISELRATEQSLVVEK